MNIGVHFSPHSFSSTLSFRGKGFVLWSTFSKGPLVPIGFFRKNFSGKIGSYWVNYPQIGGFTFWDVGIFKPPWFFSAKNWAPKTKALPVWGDKFSKNTFLSLPPFFPVKRELWRKTIFSNLSGDTKNGLLTPPFGGDLRLKPSLFLGEIFSP